MTLLDRLLWRAAYTALLAALFAVTVLATIANGPAAVAPAAQSGGSQRGAAVEGQRHGGRLRHPWGWWGSAVDRGQLAMACAASCRDRPIAGHGPVRSTGVAGSNVWSPVAVVSCSDRGRGEVRWMGGTNPLSISAKLRWLVALGRT